MVRIGPEKREEVARLLAEGRTAEWVGDRLGIAPTTIRGWRRTDPEFQALLKAYLDGLHARGLQAVAERRAVPPSRSRARQGASAMQVVKDAMVEIGRREARRGR